MLLLGSMSLAQMTKANTKIVNQASATYKYDNQDYSTETNLVVTQVLPIYGVTVSPDGTTAVPGQMVYSLAGAEVILPYKLLNTANDFDDFSLSVIGESGSSFPPLNMRIVWDINGDGKRTGDEPFITQLTHVPSQASRSLLVFATIPQNANIGDSAFINLHARSNSDSSILDTNNVAQIEVVSGPVLDVKVDRAPSVAVPDSTITYTITGSNIGRDIARPTTLTLDGVTTNGLIIGANVPQANITPGTTYIANSAHTNSGQVIYSTDNGATWFSTPPANQTVTHVALMLNDGLTPDQAFQFDFQVLVHPDHEGGNFDVSATAKFEDASGTSFDTKSNVVEVEVIMDPNYTTLIGPLGNYADNVDGDTNADFQVVDKVIAGNKVVYKFTAWNGSKIAEILNFYAKSLPEGWTYRFLYEDGKTPLIDTDGNTFVDVGIILKKGVCNLALEVTIPSTWTYAGPYNLEIYVVLSSELSKNTLTGSDLTNPLRDTVNRTNLRINEVIPLSGVWKLNKTNTSQSTVQPNEKITYSLIFEQLSTLTVTNITISDIVPEQLMALEFNPSVQIQDENGTTKTVNATATYDSETRIISWVIPQINGKFKGRVTFAGYVKESVTAGTIISNRFTIVSSQNLVALVSNTIENKVERADLNVQKLVNKPNATIGDLLLYTLRVDGIAKESLYSLQMFDNLPFGFSYEKGSSTLNGKKIADPTLSANGRLLTFDLGTTHPSGKAEVQFMARIGPGVKIGENSNTAYAREQLTDGTIVSSLQARVSTDVSQGVFAERAWLFGRVYIDRNQNEQYDCEQDIAVPGVRIFMETGQYAITDGDGKYVIEDLRLGTHVVAVDSITLPPYTKVMDKGRHSAKNGKTQFVDVKLPTSWRSDFILETEKDKYIPCEVVFQAKISQHENTALFDSDPLEKELKRTLLLPVELDQVSKVDKFILQYAFDAISKQGKLGLNLVVRVPDEKDMPKDNTKPEQPPLTQQEIKAKILPKLQAIIEAMHQRFGLSEDRLVTKWEDGEAILPKVALSKPKEKTEKTTGIISPSDNAVVMDVNAIKVKVTSKLAIRTKLLANGQEIPVSQIGNRSFHTTTGETTFEYVGVPLQLGKNTIELVSKDAKGQEEKESITVYRAKPPKTIIAKVLPHQIPADGITEPVVVIELQDDEGKPATSGLFLTVTLDGQTIVTPDAQPEQLGHQLYVKDGRAECLLGSSNEVKDCKLVVEIANAKQEFRVSYLPYLRDWIIVGMGEVTAGYENWEHRDGDEGLYVDGRAAFFAKGRILGKFLLTAHYDSSLPRDDKDIITQKVDPDKYYPVYGDSSQQGYEIQSTGRLYVKLEQDRNYILYGDYQTEISGLLTAYNRTFRGLKAEIQTEYLEIKAFGTRAKQTMVKDEIRGQGISGYYFLSHQNIIENTSKVVIEIRDRFQNQRILKTIPKTLYADYEINSERGWILFDTPILSADEAGNPIYIVVTYETKEAASREYMAGVQASVKLLDEKVKVGGTYIYEGQDKGHTTLQGVHAEIKPSEHFGIRGEVARTHTYDTTDKENKSGSGYAVEATADFEEVKGKAGYQKLDKDFRNPSLSGVEEGSERYYAEAEIKIADNTKAQIHAARSETETRTLQTVGVRASTKIGDVTAMTGYQFVEEKTEDQHQRAHIFSAGAKWDIDEHWTVRLERHQVFPLDRILNQQGATQGTFTKSSSNIKDDFLNPNNGFQLDSIGDRIISRTLLGAEYRPKDWLRIWINQEFEDNFEFDLSRTVFGFNLQLNKHVDLYSSYGIENSIGDTRNQALIGIKTNIPLTQWLTGNVFVEQVQTLSGDNPDDFTSYGFGLRMNRVNEQGSLRIEFRHGNGTQFLATPALTWKMDEDFTFLWRTRHFQNGHINVFQHQTLLGLSFRPNCSDTTNLFTKVQFDWDRDNKRVPAWEEIALSNSLDLHLRPATSWDFMLRYACKLDIVKSGNSKGSSFMDLFAGRALYEFHENFDAGIHAGILHDYEGQQFQYAYGVEVGAKVVKNLWLSIGYNVKGFKDTKMVGNDFLRDGIYITIRFKFDETTAEELLPAW